MNGFPFWSWFSCIFRSLDSQIQSTMKSSWMGFYTGPDFHVSSDSQIIRNSWMGFHFSPDFHAYSDPQIRGFIVVLRAAEWFFTLVLIFMIFRSAGFLNFYAAKRCFILFLILCIFRSVGFPNLEVDWVQLISFSFLCWFLCSFRTAGLADLESH